MNYLLASLFLSSFAISLAKFARVDCPAYTAASRHSIPVRRNHEVAGEWFKMDRYVVIDCEGICCLNLQR